MNHAASCGVSRGSCAACASRTAYPSCFAARAGASSKACGTFAHGMGRGCSRFASRDSSALTAQLVHLAARQEPLCAPHRDLLRKKRGPAHFFQRAAVSRPRLLRRLLPGLGLPLPVHHRTVAVGVPDGQLRAVLFQSQLQPHAHAGAFAAVQLPQARCRRLRGGGVSFGACAEHAPVPGSS